MTTMCFLPGFDLNKHVPCSDRKIAAPVIPKSDKQAIIKIFNSGHRSFPVKDPV